MLCCFYNNNLITERFTKCMKWLTSSPHLPVEWWETGRGCITQVQATCCQIKSPSLRWASEVTRCLSALRVEYKFWLHRRNIHVYTSLKKWATWHAAAKFSTHIGFDGWTTHKKKSPEHIYVCVCAHISKKRMVYVSITWYIPELYGFCLGKLQHTMFFK